MNLDWLTASPWPILALVLGGVTLLIAAGVLMELAATRGYRRLLEQGEPAEATVLAAKDTGWRTNRRPHIGYELEVRRAGRPPYKAKARLMIDRPWSPTPYPPGSTVRVRVDPDRPERVAIEGGVPVLGGAMAAADGGMVMSLSGQLSGSSVYIVNGQQYASPDEMPPEARAAYEQASALLADADRNGVPDVFEGASAPGTPRARLRELKALLDEGLISQAEYEARRSAIIAQL